MMQPQILEEYAERIYAWSRSRTFSEEEAEDLSQEILYQAISGLKNLRDESRFEPWLWGLAANCAKVFRRKKGKERALYLYDVSEAELFEEENDTENEELYDLLREKIAMLSKSYRDVIMMYYYDGLSTKVIAEKLTLPEGTVTWRLSEARKRLEKECQDMEESALKPIEMRIDIYGSGEYGGMIPFPCDYIDDALSQNILWQCYEQARCVEELAKSLGIPAFYIEDRVKELLTRNALIETVKGKYRTDFIIWTDQHGTYCEENGEKVLKPVQEELLAALKLFYEEAGELSFDRSGRTEDELRYLLGAMAFDYIEARYGTLKAPEIPVNYDGNQWRYIANRETTYRRFSLGRQICYPLCDGVPYKHEVFWLKGFRGRQMMYSNEIRACWSVLEPDVHCEKEWMTKALERGFVARKENGSFAVTVPVFRKEQKEAFDALVERTLGTVAPRYVACVSQFVKGYQTLFPKHLEDDAKRMCRMMVYALFEVVSKLAQREGILAEPKKEWIADVLIRA